MLPAPSPSRALAQAQAKPKPETQAVLEKAKQEALKEEFSGKERVFKMCAIPRGP